LKIQLEDLLLKLPLFVILFPVLLRADAKRRISKIKIQHPEKGSFDMGRL
jgi:hypothetical protein